ILGSREFRAGSGAMAADADAEWLRWASERFGNGAGKEPEIGLEEFTRTLGIKESFFAERFFALFDSDGSGSLSREELLGSLRRLLRGNSTEKLRFLFQVYDVDGERRKSGSGGDFLGSLWDWSSRNSRFLLPAGNGSGSIDGQELLQVLRGCLRESSLALPEERLRALSQALLRACDRDRSGSISFPELREQLEAFPELLESLSIRWERDPHLGDLGRDSMGGFHCGVGSSWRGLGLDQGWGGMEQGGPFSAAVAELLQPGPGSGGVAGTAPLTGLALLPLLLAMLLGSIPCLRRRGHFQVIPGNSRPECRVPGVPFPTGRGEWIPTGNIGKEFPAGRSGECPRPGWSSLGQRGVLGSGLEGIQPGCGRRFHGMGWVWSSSQPRQSQDFGIHPTGTLWLHIRARGQWTNKLYEHFQRLESHGPEPDPPGKSRRERREQVGSSGSHGIIPCFLDGPYGSPSRRIFTSEHAVLIGAGIGITPFASILQSIMFRYRRRMQSCPSCRFSWREEERDEEMTLRKVDFVWITRDQQHLQWFLSLLAQLEAQQAELEPGGKFLELHLFMTSALGKGDVKALGLQLALDLLAAQEQRDSISGLRSRTQPGHPDWDK
ncbi:NOX5 oxidase, partial [Poecile atricapillus]|nr:NOX5 oxidase [Poecile atricapillus]